jgi:hypothetical protein
MFSSLSGCLAADDTAKPPGGRERWKARPIAGEGSRIAAKAGALAGVSRPPRRLFHLFLQEKNRRGIPPTGHDAACTELSAISFIVLMWKLQ